jgi:exoribonuclease-2
VVLGPDGKAKLSVVAWPRANKVALATKALALAIPGRFTSADLDAMLGGNGEGLEEEDLQLAWEVVTDASESEASSSSSPAAAAPLPELAELLFGSAAPSELVRAYDLLCDPQAGGRYFVAAKSAPAAASADGAPLVPPPAFSARTAEAVEVARAAAMAEAEARREEQAFVAAVEEARGRRGAGAAAAGTREAWEEWLGGKGGDAEPPFAARIRALRALALWAPTGEAPQPPRDQQQQQGRGGQQQPPQLSAAVAATLLAGPALPPPPRGLAAPEDDLSPALPLGLRSGGGGGDDNKALFSPALLELGRRTVALFEGGGQSASPSPPATTTTTTTTGDLQALASASNAAWRLLVDLGLARPHDPRPLLAAGVDPRRCFSPALESAAATLVAAAPSLPDPHASQRLPFGGAEAAAEGPTSSSSSSRRLRVFAIDDADTLDVDDAVSAEPLPGGRLRVWVHVADPTRWLLPAALGDGDGSGGAASFSQQQRLIELSRALLSADGDMAVAGGDSSSTSTVTAAARSLLVEARRRTRSLYLPFGSVPMLPDVLSAGLFSLVPSDEAVRLARELSPAAGAAVAAQDRCALSFSAVLEAGGSGELVPGSVVIAPSVVRVTDPMTYDEADEALAIGAAAAAAAGETLGDGDAETPLQDRDAALQLLYAASRRRREWRDAQGAITIDTPETKLVVAEEDLGLPGGAGNSTTNAIPAPRVTATRLSQWESAARQLVAEAMILAGSCAGQAGAARGPLPLPYRSQPSPADLPSARELDALPPGPCQGYALRRRMTRSACATKPSLHAALGLAEYVQVTSPIRRFGDLLAHAALKEEVVGEEEAPPPLFDAGALTSALAEQSASADPLGRAERDVERYWRAEWARQRRAEDAPLDAFVLGWAGRGGGGGGSGGGGGGNNNGGLAALSLEASGLEAVARVWWPAQPGERVQALVEEARPGRGGFWRVAVTGPVGGGGDGEGGSGGGGFLIEEVGAAASSTERGFLDGDDEDEEDEEAQEEDGEEEEEGNAAAAAAAADDDDEEKDA